MTSVGELVPLKARTTRDEATSWVGMLLFLASWAMMFGTLFFAYAYVRTHARAWPPAGLPRLPLGPGVANTVLLALSSAALHSGMVGLRRAKRRWLTPALVSAWGLGALFVVGQLLLWRALHQGGLPLKGTGTYGSVFYGLTFLHAVHVLVGLAGLGWMALRSVRGVFTPARHGVLRMWAVYWHFVGVVWLVLFVTVFCV